MKGDTNEIAGIINECFYYLNRIHYHANKLYSIDKSSVSLPAKTDKQFQEWNEQRVAFTNKCRLRQMKIKPFFTQLIIDLHHIFKFSIFDSYKQNLAGGKFTRLKNGTRKDVDNIKRAVIFFRDAIVHPEHSRKLPSPRSLPTLPHIYQSAYLYLYPNIDETDYCVQIGEGKIYLKTDILECLKKLKKQCIKSDSKNILKNFKWIK